MPFAPSDLSGLSCWLKADDYTQADGSAAPSTWTDASSGGHNAAKSSTVTYRTARTPTGGPSFEFTSAGGFYDLTTSFSGFTAATVIIVLKNNTSSGAEGKGPWQLGGGDYTYYEYSDGKVYDGAFTSGRTSFTPSLTTRAWRRFAITSGSGTYHAYLDNVSQATASLTFAAVASAAVIGKNPVGTWIGEVAEFLVYNRVLNSTELGQVDDYLYTRHIDGSLAVSVPAATGTADAPAPTISAGDTIDAPAATGTGDAPAPTVATGVTVDVPAATATANAPAPAVGQAVQFAAYDLDANSSQALQVKVTMSATLVANTRPVLPTSWAEAQIRTRRLSLVMPTPSLDSNGRPT